MTLISTFGVGQSVCVISGDTRQVMELFGQNIKVPDMETKIYRISDTFIAAGGGFNSIYEYVIEELKTLNSNSAQEIYARLNELAQVVPEEFNTSFKIRKDLFFAVQIMGFDIRTGNMYNITYHMDSGVNMFEVPAKKVSGSIIVPGDFSEAYSRTGDINEAIRDFDNVTTLIEDIINYSLHLQYELMNDYPDEISNTFCYYALALVNGEVMHFEGRAEI